MGVVIEGAADEHVEIRVGGFIINRPSGVAACREKVPASLVRAPKFEQLANRVSAGFSLQLGLASCFGGFLRANISRWKEAADSSASNHARNTRPQIQPRVVCEKRSLVCPEASDFVASP